MTRGIRFQVRMLLGIALLGVALGFTHAWGAPRPQLLVTPQQVRAHLHDPTWRLVDVRPPAVYQAGHLPGAVNLPIADLTQTRAGIPGMLAPVDVVTQALGARGISSTHRVVIYDDIGGIQAARLFWVLDYLGHGQMALLEGGYQQWLRDGHPIDHTPPQVASTTYRAAPEASRLADKTWVREHLRDARVRLLDARSPAEYTGAVPGRQVPRAGHIPGAVNVDWVNNLTPEPYRFKALPELQQLYEQAGVTPEQEVAVYCRTGMRAAHDYFVLRLLGYPRVRLYDGSFVEWSADSTLPVEP